MKYYYITARMAIFKRLKMPRIDEFENSYNFPIAVKNYTLENHSAVFTKTEHTSTL